jgi:hypothetical protein
LARVAEGEDEEVPASLAPIRVRCLPNIGGESDVQRERRVAAKPTFFAVFGNLVQGVIEVAFILWLIAVALVVAGIVAIVRGEVLWGIALIIIGLLVGPGGVSVFD